MRFDTPPQVAIQRPQTLWEAPFWCIVRRVSILAASSPKTIDSYVTVFAALSEPLRVRILHMMAHEDGGELPCTTLDERLPVGKSTVSYHVAILRRAGLVTVRKSGRNYFYQLRADVLEQLAPGFMDLLQRNEELELSVA